MKNLGRMGPRGARKAPLTTEALVTEGGSEKSPPGENGTPSLRLEWRTAGELADNPRNWRKHPPAQMRALRAAKDAVGWAGAALYNEQTGRLIDGHARKRIAGRDELVPVLVGRWSEAEEATILATLDPVGALAQTDRAALQDLIAEAPDPSSDALKDLFDRLAPPVVEPTVEEIPAGDVADRFWIAIRGPLEHQAEVLQ